MMGELEIGKQKEFKDWPQLNYFHFTHARNGGPIGKVLLLAAATKDI